MARKSTPVRRLADLPDSFKSLKGFNEIVVERDGENESAHIPGITDATEFPGGTWKVTMTLPTELSLIADHLDPLIILAGLGGAAYEVENKLAEVVRFCRAEGKTWTQIGEALGTSKQSAWERFSGEE